MRLVSALDKATAVFLLIVFHFVHRLIHNYCMFCVCQSFNKEATYLLT